MLHKAFSSSTVIYKPLFLFKKKEIIFHISDMNNNK